MKNWILGLRRWSILDFLLMVLLTALALSAWSASRDLESLRSTVRRLRNEAGELTVDDSSSVYVIGLPDTPVGGGAWRLHVPKQKEALLRATYTIDGGGEDKSPETVAAAQQRIGEGIQTVRFEWEPATAGLGIFRLKTRHGETTADTPSLNASDLRSSTWIPHTSRFSRRCDSEDPEVLLEWSGTDFESLDSFRERLAETARAGGSQRDLVEVLKAAPLPTPINHRIQVTLELVDP